MIGYLKGTVLDLEQKSILLEVHDVGYILYMPTTDIANLHVGQSLEVFTSMMVSQDNIALYAFITRSAQKLFLDLQKTSGIGPKAALSILSTLTVNDIAQAIVDNDVALLSRAPGLGKKTAQKLILELKGHINLDSIGENGDGELRNAYSGDMNFGKKTHYAHNEQDIIDALVNLGYRLPLAQEALEVAKSSLGIDEIAHSDMPQVLKTALNSFSRN